MHNIISKTHYSAPIVEQFWHFGPPPTGKKLQLLTIGGVCVYGIFVGRMGQYYTAWAPLIERSVVPDD